MKDSRFERFAERKTQEAESAAIYPLLTEGDGLPARALATIGNDWTTHYYDGGFHLFDPPAAMPSLDLVFVQSSDGNTAAANPATLGGGPTDLHLIYEGLSRVATDAVLAGAASVAGRDVCFSVWHPALVALRRALSLPRHPAQIVVSAHGRVDLEGGVLFNVPGVPVFVLAGAQCRARWAAGFASRPWITLLPLESEASARRSRGCGPTRASAGSR
jgi:hypothetical protein